MATLTGASSVLKQPGRLLILLLLAFSVSTGATAQTAPTIGEIENFSFDCQTGNFTFDVYVENVQRWNGGTSGFDYPVFYNYTATYEDGSEFFPTRQSVWNPPEGQETYTGMLTLMGSVPLTDTTGDPSTATPITSIFIYAGVGTGPNAYASATDESTATFSIDCSDNPPPMTYMCPDGTDVWDMNGDGVADANDCPPPPPPAGDNGAGVPDGVTLPEEANVPANPGPPAGLDLPENAGPPEERGRPENPGRPSDPGPKKK